MLAIQRTFLSTQAEQKAGTTEGGETGLTHITQESRWCLRLGHVARKVTRKADSRWHLEVALTGTAHSLGLWSVRGS